MFLKIRRLSTKFETNQAFLNFLIVALNAFTNSFTREMKTAIIKYYYLAFLFNYCTFIILI